jgi:hypothetical protein
MLPWLATYMGHVHYSDTAYYITGTPELLAPVADRRPATVDEQRRSYETTRAESPDPVGVLLSP